MTGKGHGNRAQDAAVIAARRAEVATLRRKRMSLRAIARALGIPYITAKRDVDALTKEWQQSADEEIEKALALELVAYDASEANLISIAEDEEQAPATRIAAEQAISRIRDGRARVKGFNAAQRMEISGKDGGPITVSDYRSELAEAINKVITARGTGSLLGESEPGGAEAPGDGLAPPPGEG
jgi:hypothetical protein